MATKEKIKERLEKARMAAVRASKGIASAPQKTFVKLKAAQPKSFNKQKTVQNVTKAFSQSASNSQLKAQRIAQLQAYRAKKKQLQALAAVADKGVQYPNKFKRIAAARAMRLNEMDANRRFHAPDPNHATEMNRLHQLERDRRQEDERKFSLLKAHENMADVRIDFTDTSNPANNILAAPNIWASDNPANRNIMVTGRPTILTPNPQDKINKERARLRFF